MGLRLFLREFGDRLESRVTTPEVGRPLSYRKHLEVQARRVARAVLGQESYRPFRAR